jgi:hypothetical protein
LQCNTWNSINFTTIFPLSVFPPRPPRPRVSSALALVATTPRKARPLSDAHAMPERHFARYRIKINQAISNPETSLDSGKIKAASFGCCSGRSSQIKVNQAPSNFDAKGIAVLATSRHPPKFSLASAGAAL